MAFRDRDSSDALMRQCVDTLRHLSFLKDCKELFLDHLAMNSDTRIALAEEVIFSKGDDAHELIILRRGRAEAIQEDGSKIDFHDGSILGDPSALFVQQQRPYTLRTTEMSDLQILTHKEFQASLSVHPAEGARVAHRLEVEMCSYVHGKSKAFASAEWHEHVKSPESSMHMSTSNMTHMLSHRSSHSSHNRAKAQEDVDATNETEMNISGFVQRRATGTASNVEGTDNVKSMRFSRKVAFKSESSEVSSGSKGRQFTPQQPPTPKRDSAFVHKVPNKVKAQEPRGHDNDYSVEGSLNQPPAIPKQTPERASTSSELMPVPMQSKGQRRVSMMPASPESIKTWAYSLQEDSEASRRDLAAWLDDIPLFSRMDPFFVESILQVFEKRRFKFDEHIVSRGKPTDAFHIIYAGKANVIMNGVPTDEIGPRSIIGERAFAACGVEEVFSSVSIIAHSPVVETVALPILSLDKFLRENPAVQRLFQEQIDKKSLRRVERGFYSLALFRGCDMRFVQVLEMNVEQRLIPKGISFFHQGDTSSEAFLLSMGMVQVIRRAYPSKQYFVNDYADAIIFGEFNLLGITPLREITVTALTDCRTQVIFPDSLRKTLHQFPSESIIFRDLVEDTSDYVEYQLRPRMLNRKLQRLQSLRFSRMASRRSSRMSRRASRRLSRKASRRRSSVSFLHRRSVASTASATTKASEESLSDTESDDEGIVDDFSHNSKRSKTMRQNKGEFDLKVRCNPSLNVVEELSDCSLEFLSHLADCMSERIYMPEQIVMYEGEEMTELHMLQLGRCGISFKGEDLASVEAPSLVGSLMALMTPVVITTVVAEVTCFVATISKSDFAACLDGYPRDRQLILQLAHDTYQDTSGNFAETMGKKLENQLREVASLSVLRDSSSEFVSRLASIVEPKILLPGQIASEEDEESDDSEDDEGDDEDDDLSGRIGPKIYIIFDGLCHLVHQLSVVGALHSGDIFGVLDVWGISDKQSKSWVVKAVELCKVGAVERNELFSLLSEFPEELVRFESLVHNRLEDGVHARVAHLPCFDGLSNQFLSKLCRCLDRRICYPDANIVQEFSLGNSMFIVNLGKAHITFQGIVIGMVWAGKTFGAGQLLGISRQYHATLRTKTTCHLLELTQKSLSAIIHGNAERQWLMGWRQRAKASMESDIKLMKKKVREYRRMLRLGHIGEGDESVFLSGVISAWHRAVSTRFAPRRHADTRSMHPPSSKLMDFQAKDYMQTLAPLKFSRGLNKVELEISARDFTSNRAWRHWGQSGRLDVWKSTANPKWLAAVRQEIPKQLMSLKEEARGESSRLPCLNKMFQ